MHTQFKVCQQRKKEINTEFHKILSEETKNWSMTIALMELKQIYPPKDVQENINKMVKAKTEKMVAIDYSTATERVADSMKMGKIKEAEGTKQSKILNAEGEAEAIKLANEAADKYFRSNALLLKKQEMVEASLK